MFQYKQSRKKVKSLWGRGKGWPEEWSVLRGSPTLNPQGVGWVLTASMAGQDGTKDDSAWPSGQDTRPAALLALQALWGAIQHDGEEAS